MELSDKLKSATIENLKQIDILMMDTYARRNQETLDFLYYQGILDDSSIEDALEIAIFNQARHDYDVMTTKIRSYPIFADHVGRPDCLAYALDKGKFSRKEIKKIPFEHGDTIETFSQKYGKENLPSVIREELLNPKPLIKVKCDFDPHPANSCNN